jgi:hypothetical protein
VGRGGITTVLGGGMSDELLLRARPTTVEAKRVTPESRQGIVDWINQDRSAWTYGMTGLTWWQDGVIHDAHLGDWVVLTPWGEFQKVSDSVLFARYESIVPAVSE